MCRWRSAIQEWFKDTWDSKIIKILICDYRDAREYLIKFILMEANETFAVIELQDTNKCASVYVKMLDLIYISNLEKCRLDNSVFVSEKWWKRKKNEIEGVHTQDASVLVSSLSQSVHFNLFNSVICDPSNPPLLTSDVSTDINKLRIFLSISRSRITSKCTDTSADVNFPWIRFASRHVFHWIRLE